MRVAILADDLNWSTRLAEAVRAGGGEPRVVRSLDALGSALPEVDAVVVDLTARAYDGLEALGAAQVPLRLDASTSWARIRRAVTSATRKVQLAAVEDSVDAVVCAYVAALRARAPDRTRVLGTLADIEDWGTFNEVYKATFRAPYPTRTVVGAQLHGFLVEITVVAYKR